MPYYSPQIASDPDASHGFSQVPTGLSRIRT